MCAAVVVSVSGGVGCGPSFQAIYEGNARFEHCYALEENPHVPMPEKASCWRDWSEHYTYGQTRDRVHYATARYVALWQAPNLPTDEALMMAAPGETPRVTTITAPAPTNAFAPPPKVLEAPDPKEKEKSGRDEPSGAANIPMFAVDSGPPESAPPTLPAGPCTETCESTYRACSGGCPGDAAAPASASKVKACQACRKTYRTCMRDCFK